MEGRNIARTMTSTSMMVIVGLLEKISASKAAVEKKAREQKELLQKVISILHFMVQGGRHVNLKPMQKVNENYVAGEAIRQAALKGMCAQRSDSEIVPDSKEERTCTSRKLKRHHDENDGEVDHSSEECTSLRRGPKRRRCGRNKHDEKYDAIFQLLERAEERSKRMEMRAEENQQEAFEQVTKVLESYNRLSERILHAIVNIGGSDNV